MANSHAGSMQGISEGTGPGRHSCHGGALHHCACALRRDEGEYVEIYHDTCDGYDDAGAGHFARDNKMKKNTWVVGKGQRGWSAEQNRISDAAGNGRRKHRSWLRMEAGNVGDMMACCLCMLAMTVLMLAYMGNVSLVFQKAAVSQLARKYILRMETVGELTANDRTELIAELEALGASQISLEGTSGKVSYGETVELVINGKLEEEYDFTERRLSTAKN